MKVICVSHNDKRNNTWIPWNESDPQIGDECIVNRTYLHSSGVTVYSLLGYPEAYDVNCFSTSSNIDETTFERNYQAATI